MTIIRETHRSRAPLACVLVAAALLATDLAAAPPKVVYEATPGLAAADLAPAELLKGPLHSVADKVELDGNFGRFVIESKFGVFSVMGVSMLRVRVHELRAIEALQEVQSTQAFRDSLARAAQAPVQLVQSAVTNPLGTVENVGQGFGNVMGRVGFLMRSGAQTVVDSTSRTPAKPGMPSPQAGEVAPPPIHGDPFGYNKARRDWARQLNIDPYTSNPVLTPLLDDAASASFVGSFAINTGLSAVSMGANLLVTFDTDVRDAVWNQPAVDLARQNESRLRAMGVSGRTTRDFLRNRWFTPSLQTALVAALDKLGGIGGVESLVRVAAQVPGESHVRFLVESLRMLGQFHGKETPLVKLQMSRMVPVGIAAGKTVVAAAAIDFAYWDSAAAEFARRSELKGKRRILLVSGTATERAKEEYSKAGWEVRSGLRG